MEKLLYVYIVTEIETIAHCSMVCLV